MSKKMLRAFLFIFSFCLYSNVASSSVYAFSGSGSGTSGSPYLLTSCAQLQEIDDGLSAYYQQTQNIDCDGVSFTPLASGGFSGTLDGQGYAISNITISGGSSNYQALFSNTSAGAVIKNVHLSGGSITTTGLYAASFIGYVNGTTTVQDSSSNMTINGNAVGGFIGTTNGSFSTTITRSSFTGNLTSTGAYLGGFIAVMLGGSTTISDSYTSGTYTGTEYVGGLVGYLTGASISTSYSTASITANGSDFVGGLAGIFTGTISNSFSAASVGGTSTNQGGVSGQADTFSNVYYDISASGQSVCTDSGSSSSCTGVNSGNSNPDYFKNNKTSAPLNTWNFSSIWKRTTSYPVFGTDPGDPSSQNSGSSSSSPSSPSCGDAVPTNAPDLFQIDVSNMQAILYFAPANNANKYFIAYGNGGSTGQYGVEFDSGVSTGVIAYTINALSPNTDYSFIVRGGNGCMPGDWGNTMQVKTRSSQTGGTSFYKNFAARFLSIFPRQVASAGIGSNVLGAVTSSVKGCQEYTVKSGDNLWNIASQNLGSGNKYTELMQKNSLSSTFLNIGLVLKVGC